MFISIRAKLGSMLFLSVFAVTLLIVSAQQYHSYLNFKKYVRTTSETAVKVAIDLSDKWINDHLNLAQVAAYRIEKSITSGSDVGRDLSEFAADNRLSSVYYGDDASGTILDSGSGSTHSSGALKELKWYAAAKSGKQATFVPPTLNADAGNRVMTFAAPVFDGNRWVMKGAVGFDMPFNELSAVIGSIFVMPIERLLPFDLQGGRMGILVQAVGMTDRDAQAIISKYTANSDAAPTANFSTTNEQYILIAEKLTAVDGLMVYPIAMKSLIQPLLIQAAAYFAVTAGCLLMIVNVAWLILGRYIRRIERLSVAAQAVAAGKFDTEVPKMPDDEIGRLGIAFNTMVRDLRQFMTTLEITTREKEAIAKELEIAAQLQEKALPRHVPNVPGLEVAARSFPAKSVGGDYYDFIYPGDGKVGFVVADAAGKGFPGSLYMSNSRSIFRVISLTETSPGAMLQKTNDCMVDDASQDGMFITYIFGMYDGKTHKLTYSNAGHFPPLLYNTKEKKFKTLGEGGMPIGIMGGTAFEEESVDFLPGDILVLYTDGIIEAMNLSHEMFGIEQLEQVIRDHSSKSASAMIEQISSHVAGFVGAAPQHDDMTVVVVKAVA
jgi:sigma-B regulation protein RsbU (phosphoserine phosphatase)